MAQWLCVSTVRRLAPLRVVRCGKHSTCRGRAACVQGTILSNTGAASDVVPDAVSADSAPDHAVGTSADALPERVPPHDMSHEEQGQRARDRARTVLHEVALRARLNRAISAPVRPPIQPL